ncbi:MAG: HK97 family phage prohead protease [Candidatus Hydrogenedentes bacterium]|nr:HK97 family phage prohead protease [Candidatus Hydrogenedentota bacterium]
MDKKTSYDRKRDARYYPIADVRAEEGEGKRRVTGYAVVFDSLSESIGGMFREVIRPGAFRKSLQESDVLAFWNHDTSEVLGRRANGTLVLEEDAHGVRFVLDMPDTARGRDAYELIKRGDVQSMSFGFSAIKDRASVSEDGELLREVLEAQLYEISPVTFPAYRATEVEARALATERELVIPAAGGDGEPDPSAIHSADVAAWLEWKRKQLQLVEM